MGSRGNSESCCLGGAFSTNEEIGDKMRDYDADLFVVVADWRDNPSGYWVPSVRTAMEIGEIFRHQAMGGDHPQFRIYDTDTEGNLLECEIEWGPTTYTEDERDGLRDYGHPQGRIVRKGTREYLAHIAYTVDLRV